MIKVKDGYAKLVGTTYSGSADRVLLSNGGDKVVGNASGNIPLNNGTVNTNLNADLLDGLHGSWYLKNVLAFKRTAGTSENGGYDLNTLTDGMVYNYGSLAYWANGPSGMSYGRVLNLKDGTGNSISALLAWDINHASTTDTTRNLWWRASDDGTFTEAQWHKIAFIDNLPTVTDYYWANVKVSDTSNAATKPTFATATATTSVTTPLVTSSGVLKLNGTSGIYLRYNDTDASSLVLSSTYFKPFDSANNKLSLGTSSARWSNIYSVAGNFSGNVTIAGTMSSANYLLGDSLELKTDDTACQTTVFGSNGSGYRMRIVRLATSTNLNTLYSPTLVISSLDTHAYIAWRYDSDSVWVGGGSGNKWSWRSKLITSVNYGSYLGYIGTTAVLKSGAAQALTGITSATLSSTLTLTGTTSATARINFSRGSDHDYPYNYITAPTGGIITIEPGGLSCSSSTGYLFTATTLLPGATNTYDLGTSGLKWRNVYATTFTGDLSGNASSSTYTTYIRVTETEPTTGTYYYPIWTSGMTSGSNYTPRANDGFRYYTLEGTDSAKGTSLLFLGNNIASGTAGNKEGRLGIYGPNSYYAYLYGPDAATGTFYFPNAGGTLVTHATRGTAVGAPQTPVYIAANGRATAITIADGSGDIDRKLLVTNGSNGIYSTATITGNYTTGNLTSTVSSTGDVRHTCTNSNGSISLYASTNRGLHDTTNSAWIIYLTKAADHVYVPKWASKGSATLPVYFNSSGEPVACTSYAKAIKDITRSGTTFTYTCIDGTTGTFTLLDNNTTYTFAGGTDKFTVTPSGGTALTVNVQNLLVNGTYTGNGGEQRPSYIGSGKVRWNMMRATTTYFSSAAYSGYCDWMMMDTYTGSDVPYVTMMGVLKADSPRAFIASGAKGDSSGKWTIKELALKADIPSIPSISITNAGSGNAVTSITASGHTLTVTKGSTFSLSGHTHSYVPLAGTTALTGSIEMKDSITSVPFVRNFISTTTTGWARGVLAFKVDGTAKFTIGAFGSYTAGGSSNGISYAYIGCNAYDGVNLRIASDSLKWGTNNVLHAGNSSVSGDGGSTWGSSITVKINGTSKTLTIPSAPSIPTVTNYYWANVKVSASSNSATTPTFSKVNISYSSYPGLLITRSGSTNGALIGFANSNGTLGGIGMSSTANGGLKRYTADYNTAYTVCDTGNTSFTQSLTSGTTIGTLKIAGTSYTLYCLTNTNTDTKVTQSLTTTANYRPIVLGYASSGTAGDAALYASLTNVAYTTNTIYALPSTGNLYAASFYTSSLACIKSDARTSAHIYFYVNSKTILVATATEIKPGSSLAGIANVGTSDRMWNVVYANKWGTSTVGGAAKPIYLNAGAFTACSSTVGGTAKPVYMSSGTITACSSTVGSGTVPVYMSSGTITASSSTVGSSALPVYMNAGTITTCSYGFKGSSTNPVIIWCGYAYRTYNSTSWTLSKSGGWASASLSVSNANTYGYLQVSLPNCTVYGAFCSTIAFYDGDSEKYASNTSTTTGRSSGMGDYQTFCSGTSVYIKKFNLGDADNDTWRNNGLLITATSSGNKPVTRFYIMIIGYYSG